MLKPTVFILLAPTAIGFISYVKIFGEANAFAFILYGFAFYLGLLLLFQIKYYLKVSFFVSWWEMLFPNAAVTNATFLMYEITNLFYLKYLIHVQLFCLFILELYFLLHIFGIYFNNTICFLYY